MNSLGFEGLQPPERPENLTIVPPEETDFEGISRTIDAVSEGRGIETMTNGVYGGPMVKGTSHKDLQTFYAGTVIAAIAHDEDENVGETGFDEEPGAIVILVNNEESVDAMYAQKKAAASDDAAREQLDTERQNAMHPAGDRMEAIGRAVALAFPEREVVLAPYKEETPQALIDHLADEGLISIATTHFKWGYGAGAIVGAQTVQQQNGTVVSHPFPGQDAPFAADITDRQPGEPDAVVPLHTGDSPLLTATPPYRAILEGVPAGLEHSVITPEPAKAAPAPAAKRPAPGGRTPSGQ